ncbi:MAG TPA: hypothetical protein PK414_03685 [Anaerolineales bacterium]|nr:hypothetical protein [Anaerolineales bacterium]
MKTLRISLAILLAMLFVITAVLALLLFNFDRRAFSAETYQQAFAREDFYNKIPSLLAQSILSGTDPTQQPFGMQGLSQETWDGFFRTLLPSDVLKPIGDDMLGSTFAYINLESDSIQVNLGPVKANMLGETGIQAALVLVKSLPACTIDQAAMIMFGMFSGDQIQLCNPPENVLPMLMPLIQGQMQVAASLIPDQLTLITAPPQNDPRLRLQSARLFMRFSPILPLVFLLGLTALGVRSFRDWLNWWGIPFAVTGIIAAILGFVGGPILGGLLSSYIANWMQAVLPSAFFTFANELATAMANALLTPVMWQGWILTVIGIGMVAVGILLGMWRRAE